MDSNTHKACAYIINSEGSYLLQRRSWNMNDDSDGQLTLFWWWVDIGETVIQWLVRELQEELELDITLCDIRYVWCHVSSTGVRFEIFEVHMNHPQHLVLHEWDEIVIIVKEQLSDPQITSWFQKINYIYLKYVLWS